MAGFNVPTQFPPELLAQIAAAAFKPPHAMNMPGLNVPTDPPPAPGFNVRDGMAALSAGLSAISKMPGSVEAARTAGDADLGGYSKTGPGGMVDVGGGVMLPNPNRPDSYQRPDFLTGLFGKLGLSSGGGSGAGGASGAGSGGAGAVAVPAAIAAAIGFGKNTEANHANTPVGDVLLGGLGPSATQMFKDPLGMGLPTLLGAPFITPFTASRDAKKEKPEWSSFFSIGV